MNRKREIRRDAKIGETNRGKRREYRIERRDEKVKIKSVREK